MNIVFMGTPEFAVPSLRKLAQNHAVKAVVTAPDRPAGRGKKLTPSAVKEAAENMGIPVLQPVNLKDPSFHEDLASFKASLFVVVAFRMLPKAVWEMPPAGTINLHASLLPQYRGAAPINHAIINGESETGLTTFYLDEKIDTGSIIDQIRVQIGPLETAGELHDRMMELGASFLVETVNKIEAGESEPVSQDSLAKGSSLKEAPKIFKNDCRIIWKQPAENIFNFIRGLSPYPGAFTEVKGMDADHIKIFLSHISDDQSSEAPGTVEFRSNSIVVHTQTNLLVIDALQIPGKRRVSSEEFLRGFKSEQQILFT